MIFVNFMLYLLMLWPKYIPETVLCQKETIVMNNLVLWFLQLSVQ